MLGKSACKEGETCEHGCGSKCVHWTLAVLAVSAIVTLLSLSWYLIDKNSKVVSQRVAYFSAQGKIYVKPDTAEANFGVITQNVSAKDAVSENNKAMDSIIGYLKAGGIKAEDIQTTNYSLYPQYDYNYCLTSPAEAKTCPPKIVGYEINQSVTFKSKDFDKMASALGGLAEQGANNISNLTFTIEDPEAYRSGARKLAIDSAKAKAVDFAETAGLSLGRISNVTEDYSGPGPQPYYAMEKGIGGGSAAPAPAPIEAGSQEVIVNVNLTYEIK